MMPRDSWDNITRHLTGAVLLRIINVKNFYKTGLMSTSGSLAFVKESFVMFFNLSLPDDDKMMNK